MALIVCRRDRVEFWSSPSLLSASALRSRVYFPIIIVHSESGETEGGPASGLKVLIVDASCFFCLSSTATHPLECARAISVLPEGGTLFLPQQTREHRKEQVDPRNAQLGCQSSTLRVSPSLVFTLFVSTFSRMKSWITLGYFCQSVNTQTTSLPGSIV